MALMRLRREQMAEVAQEKITNAGPKPAFLHAFFHQLPILVTWRRKMKLELNGTTRLKGTRVGMKTYSYKFFYTFTY